MSVKPVVVLGVACLLFSIGYYQFILRESSQLDIVERTAVELRKIIGKRPTTYRKIAVGLVLFTYTLTVQCLPHGL